MFLGSLLALCITMAAADEADARRQLETALEAYQAGDPAAAREALTRVLAEGPSLPPEIRQEALAYLGDILYSEEGPEAARTAFEALLSESPAYAMDAFRHPPEVRRFFEDLRARFVVPPSPPPVEPADDRWPARVLIPGGIWYFEQGRPGAGLLVGSAQLVGAGVSWYTFARLVRWEPVLPGDDAAAAAYLRARTLNWTAGTLGTLALITPVILETVSWSQERAEVTARITPGGLVVVGSF